MAQNIKKTLNPTSQWNPKFSNSEIHMKNQENQFKIMNQLEPENPCQEEETRIEWNQYDKWILHAGERRSLVLHVLRNGN